MNKAESLKHRKIYRILEIIYIILYNPNIKISTLVRSEMLRSRKYNFAVAYSMMNSRRDKFLGSSGETEQLSPGGAYP